MPKPLFNAPPKPTKEEKQLLSLCQLLSNLRDIKRQEQVKVQQVSVKKNVKVDDDSSSSIEKAKKLLQEAQQDEAAKSLSVGTKKRTSASLRAREGSPPTKRSRPTLPSSSPSLSLSPSLSPSRHTNESPPSQAHRGNNQPSSSNCQIFIGDLNPHLSPEEHHRLLQDSFSKYGMIISLRILTGKNCGFILFENRTDAEAAIEGMNRQPLGGSTIRVTWGKERFGNNRRF